MAPTVLHDEVCRQYQVKRIGEVADLIEEFYVISVERRITHPGVAAITQAAREGLFAAWGL
jgi:LysR family transcriptional activator of nhaA